MKILRNWCVVNVNGELSLFGHIYNDPRHNPKTGEFEDGHRIITSKIDKLDEISGCAYTRSSVYKLEDYKPISDEDLAFISLFQKVERV